MVEQHHLGVPNARRSLTAPSVGAFPFDPQRSWAFTPLQKRLECLRRIRHLLATQTESLTAAIPQDLPRTPADTLAAEVLPLLAAIKFLEDEAPAILATRKLGRRGLPFWLAGLDASIERAPLGTILIVAPFNYPLFLPAAQAVQALAAGNAVVWKPGRNGRPIAELFAEICIQAELPAGLLRVTDECVEAVAAEIDKVPAKIIFTGSSAAGRAVQRLAAEHSIPVVAELSGCDAVVVLRSADAALVADALCFGMRLNGSATCMAPRRLILVGSGHEALLDELARRFAAMDAIFIPERTRLLLQSLFADAESLGASIGGELGPLSMQPILVRNGSTQMQLARTDVFAPVLTVLEAATAEEAIVFHESCPYALTAAIFGDVSEARALATHLTAGVILINDLIVPTADPRVPFGGRRGSGFGTTRGAEGLLELTAAKTLSVRRRNTRRHFQPTTAAHEQLFRGVAILGHAKSWRERFIGLRQAVVNAVKLDRKS